MGDEARTKPKKRRARAELRELMITAGVEVLLAHGVELQISSVSYARVFEHLERTAGVRVTYGSVHERIWDSLQDYQLSVIERAGIWDLAAPLDGMPAGAVDAAEVWRRMGEARFDGAPEIWASWLATIVALRTHPDDTAVAGAARLGAETNYRRLEEQFTRTVGAELRRMGYRPDDMFVEEDEAWAMLAHMSVAVADGLDLRRTLTSGPEPELDLLTGSDGGPESWTAYSLAMWGLTRSFFHRP